MVSAGSPAGPTFSSTWVFSRACSAGWSWRSLLSLIAPAFFGKHASLTNTRAFAAYLAPLRNKDWVVYAKRPFGGPEEVLRYLARYPPRRHLQPPPDLGR